MTTGEPDERFFRFLPISQTHRKKIAVPAVLVGRLVERTLGRTHKRFYKKCHALIKLVA